MRSPELANMIVRLDKGRALVEVLDVHKENADIYRSAFSYGGYYDHVPHRFSDFHYPFGHGFEPRGEFPEGAFKRGTVPRVGAIKGKRPLLSPIR